MRLILLVIAAALPAFVARADIVRSSAAWSTKPDFGKSADARAALSGAACVAATGHCLAVNDEKRYAQFFDIENNTIVPREIIRLVPDNVDGVDMDEIDAEGVAYAPTSSSKQPSYFYIIGSHGLSRKGELQPSRFLFIRFPVDPSSGRPTFSFGDNGPAPEISRTAQLRDAIKNAVELSAYAEQKLDRNGVTIEGVAIDHESALFGLRSPCVSTNAFFMRTPLKDLFTQVVPAVTTSKLALGDNVGVRDLAKVANGVLILSGRSDDDRGDQKFACGEQKPPSSPQPSIWFWSGKDEDRPEFLGPLPGVASTDSAETLLVLDENEKMYRVLILFDGVENGAPVEFIINK